MIRAEEWTLKCVGCDYSRKQIGLVDFGGVLIPLVRPFCSRGEDGCIIPHNDNEKAPMAKQVFYSGR